MCQWINMCELLCWNTIKDTRQSWLTQFRNNRPFCRRCRMICFTSSLIRQLYHFATVFDRVLLQLVGTDIANSLFKYTEWGIWHSWLKHLNCWWKAVKNLICYLCIFNVQLHVHFKKWTLKFKLLYLRNYLSYFNKIRGICCVNTHIQNMKVLLKFVLPWLK